MISSLLIDLIFSVYGCSGHPIEERNSLRCEFSDSSMVKDIKDHRSGYVDGFDRQNRSRLIGHLRHKALKVTLVT